MSEGNGNKGGLAAALVKAQAEFPAIPKNRKTTIPLKNGGHREYNYADLASILDATRPALTKNGLAVTQPMAVSPEGPVLKTRLIHTSGEVLESDYQLPRGAGSQEMGSAITYGRRYSLQAILGISAEDDDDGEASTQGVAKPAKQYKLPPKDAPAPSPSPAPQEAPPASDVADDRSWETAAVVKVTEKSGDKNGKKWTRYGILLALQDGQEQWVNTFDKDYGAVAASLTGGKLARVSLKDGKPYNGQPTFDLVGIEPMQEE